MSDKRAQFFVLAAVVCGLLVPLADHEFRAVTIALGVVYLLLAAASALDHNSRG